MTWCPVCARIGTGRRLSIPWRTVPALAKKHGGQCLSKPDDYQSLESELKWRCKKLHTFSGAFRNVRQRRHFCLERRK